VVAARARGLAVAPLALLVCGVLIGFLGVTRTVEIAAVRALLDAPLDAGTARRPSVEARVRSALWFAFHLAAGGLLGCVLLVALPVLIIWSYWLIPLYAVAVVYAAAGLGALAAVVAPRLLGPDPAERLAAAEAQARRLAERNRLARELHDSIGHALTATTLQAAAAARVFERDPEFARRSLRSIEEVGRAAMEDLDRALAALRDDDRPAAAEPCLADLDRLCATVRAGGVELACEVAGDVERIPAELSREGYRIVQEGLTNAARHAGPGAVTLQVRVLDDTIGIELANPLPTRPTSGGGRGLAGVRERVTLLGGELEAGSADGVWRLSARLPR
jgi:signal transduction histidine kinase